MAAPLTDSVRAHAAAVCARARHVAVDEEALLRVVPEPPAEPPALDPEVHFLEGSELEVATYLLCADAINFGSGWFPTLNKRLRADGTPVSGATTIAWDLADAFRAHGAPDAAALRSTRADQLAGLLGQRADHELMSLYAQALRQLGAWLGERTPLDVVAAAEGSAVAFAGALAGGMAMWDDRGFFKRAQLAASDLALAGLARFGDLDELTVFADNLVPHVLRCDGALHYDDALAAAIDAEEVLPAGGAEEEIRAAAVHAGARLAGHLGIPEHELDHLLWNRGQAPEYKARPRHRCRSIFY
jgi:hypothetical protein